MKLLITFSFLFGSFALGQGLFPKAIISTAEVEQAIAIEREFESHYEQAPRPGTTWFEFKTGKSKVFVLAPHATAQIREGKVKRADKGTGSLAVMLNKIAGTPTLYTILESPSDPNYYDNNEFKGYLKTLLLELKPRLVLDLHTSNSHHSYDIDFGTRYGKSLMGQDKFLLDLGHFLKAEGILNLSQDFFPAEKQQTDTKWVSNMGVPCIQLEINYNWTSADLDDIHAQNFAKLLEGLVRFIRTID